MEHVLRQCLIALRIADAAQLDEAQHGSVYYTSLLINVGCHTDAHEQAKWFGDDIAMKSTKYDYEWRSLRGAAAPCATRRGQPAAAPLPARARVRGVRAPRHGRDAHRARAAGAHAGGAARAVGGRPRRASSTPTSSGTASGWPGEMQGERSRSRRASRQLAEFMEVAHRVNGTDAACAMARRRAGKQFDPQLAGCSPRTPAEIFEGLDDVGTWAAVIEAEPALVPVLSGERFDAGAGRDRALHRRQVAVHAGALARRSPTWPRRAGEQLGLARGRGANAAPRGPRARLRAPGRVELDLGQARAARRRRVGARPHAPVHHRAHAPAVAGAGAARRRSPSSCASASTAPATRAACRRARSAGRRGSWRPPTPTRRCASRAPHRDARAAADAARAAARRGRARAGSTARRRRRC